MPLLLWTWFKKRAEEQRRELEGGGKKKSWSHRGRRKCNTGEIYWLSRGLLQTWKTYPQLILMQANHQMFPSKACCLQLFLFTSFILIFTWQKLHLNLVNEISEMILQFLLNLQISSTVRAREHSVSVVLLPSLKPFLPYMWFPASTPSNKKSPWCGFQNIPFRVLVVHTPFSTTHLGNHNSLVSVLIQKEKIRSSHLKFFVLLVGWF